MVRERGRNKISLTGDGKEKYLAGDTLAKCIVNRPTRQVRQLERISVHLNLVCHKILNGTYNQPTEIVLVVKRIYNAEGTMLISDPYE